MLYLIIYEENFGSEQDFYICGGMTERDAIRTFYEWIGGRHGIDGSMFWKMIKHLTLSEAVAVFNGICSDHKITELYKNVDRVELGNV